MGEMKQALLPPPPNIFPPKWQPEVLTGTATLVVRDDATEVPETGFAAVAFQPPDAGFAGALARAGITAPSVGAIGVTVASAYETGGREGLALKLVS